MKAFLLLIAFVVTVNAAPRCQDLKPTVSVSSEQAHNPGDKILAKIGKNGNGGCIGKRAITDRDRATYWCSAKSGSQYIEFAYAQPCEADGYYLAGPKLHPNNKASTGGCHHWYHPPSTWSLSADGKELDARNINKMGCDESGDTTWTMPENFNKKKGSVVAKKFRVTMTKSYQWDKYIIAEMGLTLNQNPRKVTPEEISSLKCTRTNGIVKMRFTPGSKSQSLDFYGIAEDDVESSAWYCDLTTSVPFSAVKAGYTLIQIDPETKKKQDPDDNWEMKYWGQKTSSHKGYFSMGTPNVIIESGGESSHSTSTMRNTMIQGHAGKELKLTFRASKFDPSWHAGSTIRFGFSQSANHEDFTVKDFDIMITPATPREQGIIRKVIYKEGTSASGTNKAQIRVRPNTKYRVSYSVLQNDLQSANERVDKVTVDGKDLGGCNPTGSDYDCTFSQCGGTTEHSSKTGTVEIVMKYTGHSKDCECNRRNWECFQEGKAVRQQEGGAESEKKMNGGYTPVTYAAEWVFTPVDIAVGESNKHIKASLKHGVMRGDGQMRVFGNSGKDQTFVVPKGVTRMLVKLWGAGGGAEHIGKDAAYSAGSGGFVAGWMKTTPGEKLVLVVGDGGRSGNTQKNGQAIYGMGGRGRCNSDDASCTYTGSGDCLRASWESSKHGREVGDGGGMAGIFRGSVSKGNAVAVAGGGAGGSDGEAGEGASDRCDSYTESGMAGGNSPHLRRAGGGAGYCGGKYGSSGAEGGANYAGGLAAGAINTAGQDGYYGRIAQAPGRHDIDYYSPGLGYKPGVGYVNDCKNKQGGHARIVLRWAIPDTKHAIFFNTGHDSSFKVHPNARTLQVKLWGAGGGPEHIGTPAWSGGSGGFVSGEIDVTPGETLTVVAGDGGRSGNTVSASNQATYGFGGIGRCDANQGSCTYTGKSVCLTENWESTKYGREVADGGGLAGIFRGAPSQKTALAVAGGGGGPTDGQYGVGAITQCGSTTGTSLQGQNSGAVRAGGGGGGFCGGNHAANSGKTWSFGGANFVGKMKTAVNVAGTTQKTKTKPAQPPKTDDPSYIPGVGWGIADDCALSGGRKAGGPALVVVEYSTRKPLELDGAIGISLQNEKGILSFGEKRSAGFFHNTEDNGIVHFFGKDLLYKGRSLLSDGGHGRRLQDTERVQQLEAQVEALQATVRRLQETVSSLVETKSE